MIFDSALQKARQRQAALAGRLDRLKESRARLIAQLDAYTAHAARFETGLAEAHERNEPRPVPVYREVWWEKKAFVEEVELPPDAIRDVARCREAWSRVLKRLAKVRHRLDRAIKEVEEAKFRVEFWLLEKEETWGKVDPAKLKEQVKSILLAARELSRFIIGREVPIAFDTADDAPLGYVPLEKPRKSPRTVYLSGAFLGDQPEHLLDYYRALIVHELGHLLLHLKDSGREYRRFRQLLRKRITQAPDFFKVFNIVLDEQLERILRDTKPEWQGWFNRLDFHVRRVPLPVFTEFLRRAGRDPDAALKELTERRLVKVYADPQQPFAVIQSAEIFAEGLGFTRLYAFYATLRDRLPHAGIVEPWLSLCIDAIPKNFKTLDVFEVHALAVKIYKIMMSNTPASNFVTVKVQRGGVTTEIEVPGVWVRNDEEGKDPRFVLTGAARGAGLLVDPEPPVIPPPYSGPDPEGGPPPPPPPPPTPSPPPPPWYSPPPPCTPPAYPGYPTHRRCRSRGDGGGRREQSSRVSKNPYKGPSQPTGTPWLAGKKGAVTGKPSKSKQKPSAQEKLKQKAGKLSAKEKARLEKELRPSRPASPGQAGAARKARKPDEPKPTPQSRPKPSPPPARILDAGDASVDLDRLEELASEAVPTSSRHDFAGINAALDSVLQEVRKELAGKKPPVLDRMTADRGVSRDYRNESSEGSFPPPDEVITLLPDRSRNEMLTRSVRPFVNVLAPYLAPVDPARVLEERLAGGRRLLSAALTRHLAYGETRLFADQRLLESDQHHEVFLAVLIDTSVSMKNENRLDRAKQFAALLAECLRACSGVESVFLGFNQNVYLCGSHEEASIGSLEPAGKTNEAAVLDYLGRHHLETPRRRKGAVVLSDGLPTACSVEAVRLVVHRLERGTGVRCLHVALGDQPHPAYHRRVEWKGELRAQTVRAVGRALVGILG